MTIYDISEKAGVSIATVSRVLNGSGKVSEKTRKKVMDIVEQCGYTPNLFARGLGLNSMNTIGILCVDSSDIFLAKAIFYVEKNLHSMGYDSLLCCTGYDHEIIQEYLNLLISKKVDACVLIGSSLVGKTSGENKFIKEAGKKIPIMLLNSYIDAPNIYSVMADDYNATYDVTVKMFKSGKKNILYYYSSDSYSGKQKLSGFKAAMKENGIEEKDQMISYYKGSREDVNGIVDHLEDLKKQGLKFDGIITSDDNLGIASVKYAKLNDINIPNGMAVVGYNDSLLAKCCEPELTSVDNHLEILCKNLTSTLIDVLKNEKVSQKTVYSGEIVERGTTKFIKE